MKKTIINFSKSLNSRDTEEFSAVLIDEIMALKTGILPLQQGLTQGDMAAEQPDKVTVLSRKETQQCVNVKLAVYFTEIISGCSCGDDPATLDGYCEMQLKIDKQTGTGHFYVVD